jgi:alpha-tubulin suppressor-like RCC1 family protein
MAGQFISPVGDLELIFIDDYAMIDQYAKTGSLWLWGYDAIGQLGNNTIVDKSSPIQTVASGTNWKQVAAGNAHTSAIKTDGTLWIWGANDFGQLGDNTVVGKSSPIQTVAGGTNWKQVSAGDSHTAAIYFYDAGNLYPSA